MLARIPETASRLVHQLVQQSTRLLPPASESRQHTGSHFELKTTASNRPRPPRKLIPPSPPPLTVKWAVAVLDGGVAVRCNPKSALAGLKSRFKVAAAAPDSGQRSVEGLVLRGDDLRTLSGPEGSSSKECSSGAAGVPDPSKRARDQGKAPIENGCTATPL